MYTKSANNALKLMLSKKIYLKVINAINYLFHLQRVTKWSHYDISDVICK